MTDLYWTYYHLLGYLSKLYCCKQKVITEEYLSNLIILLEIIIYKINLLQIMCIKVHCTRFFLDMKQLILNSLFKFLNEIVYF